MHQLEKKEKSDTVCSNDSSESSKSDDEVAEVISIADDMLVLQEEKEFVKVTKRKTKKGQIMKQHCQNESGVTNNEKTGVQQRVEQILETEMDTYFAYIAGINFVDLIRQFPSTKYDEKTFNRDLVSVVRDPIYTARMFDVFGWWRVVGRNKFK
jgi:hypothetical protein